MALAKILRSIVRNDAMRTDPDQIYNAKVLALVCSACFGGMLFGWDTGAIGGVLAMDQTRQRFGYLHRPKTDKLNLDQNIVSTLQAGCFAACFATSWFADRFGRRRSLIGSGVITIVGVVFQAASAANGALAVMYVGRFIAGLGVGAASTLTPLYVSECVPRAIRGGLTGISALPRLRSRGLLRGLANTGPIAFYQLFIVLGIMIAFWVNYGCLLHVPAPAVFIIPLALQALPAVLLVAGMLVSPESPRWTARKDRWEETSHILVTLRGLPTDSAYVSGEMQEMVRQLENERRLMGDATFKSLMKEMWLVPANRRRTVISIVLMICQQLTGVNAIVRPKDPSLGCSSPQPVHVPDPRQNYYAPQIFTNLGMNGTDSSLFATGVYGIVKTVAVCLFLLFIADSLGRRKSLLWTSPMLVIVLFIIGIYGRVQPPVTGESVSAFWYIAITCIYLWAAIFQFGWGPSCWILVSEIPTARLRAANVAIGAGTQWLFNFVMARTVLTMQNTMGYKGYGMFFMFGSFDVLMGLFVFFFVPETKGLSLEKMDELFGMNETVKQLDVEPETGRHVSVQGDAPRKT
ncbi:General substrate transporter [Metarhizium album ARSEF 1941]|uniref:General substrate transporter n=1 Tax=Metarhizium album (strain ARSEF 1941) TaxID=1081103 RepID=A0A0B2WQC1_METAS|nr:General substrate transporter [Metarhizium album ARSEF 1941]KHN95692.1 General substrate transporter [Metarhizium album ARSEF 1941]